MEDVLKTIFGYCRKTYNLRFVCKLFNEILNDLIIEMDLVGHDFVIYKNVRKMRLDKFNVQDLIQLQSLSTYKIEENYDLNILNNLTELNLDELYTDSNSIRNLTGLTSLTCNYNIAD